MPPVSRFLAWLVGSAYLLIGALTDAQTREGWTTSRIAGTPDPPPPYRVELAFPKLTFQRPLDLSPAPGESRLFLAELDGKIYSFRNDGETSAKDLVVDLKVSRPALTAIYGIAFHPRFAENRRAFVCFVEGNDKPDGTLVCEYRMSATEPPTLDAASERVVIRWWSGGHNGGCLKFGPDGLLYISTGDGGPANPPDPLSAGQDLSNLLSAILRIDVDNMAPNQAYGVPGDNPFVGLPDARPEIWAYGFRNPWRMSFDRGSGDFWLGDVGWTMWEMIYRVERAGNYGWAVMEGPQPTLPELKRGPTPILPPIVSHPHSESSSITGGYVYHGGRLPELQGQYIYGDFQTGIVWGLRYADGQVVSQDVLARTPLQLVSFGEDSDGELYLLDYERSHQIYRLIRNAEGGQQASFPRLLSETGLFNSVVDQSPAAGVLPYSINARLWADQAESQRWIALPGTEPITIDVEGWWRFPEGTVLAKTISTALHRGDPQSRVRLETQILHRERDTWRPYSYRWNDEQTDAALVDAAGDVRLLRIRDDSAPGGVIEYPYRIASRADCQQCHNPWVERQTTFYGIQSASPLAFTRPQLNRAGQHDDSGENQLLFMRRTGWLADGLGDDPTAADSYVDPYDEAAPIVDRARTYLQVNCAHCHQPNAGGAANIDLRLTVPLEQAQVLGVRPSQGGFGIHGPSLIQPGDPLQSVLLYRLATTGAGRMPRIGSTEVDERAVVMIHDWIRQLPSTDPRLATESPSPPLRYSGGEEGFADVSVEHRLSSTRGAMDLLMRLMRNETPSPLRQQVVLQASRHGQAEVRELFERFVPADQRAQRLGAVVDVEMLLSLPADAARGRELFHRDGAAACKSCHRVQGMGEPLGPDLSEIGKKYSPRELLVHLLDPSLRIEPKYLTYLLETADGRVFTGLLEAEDEHEVVLRTAQNQLPRVRRSEIAVLAPQQKSLMPDLLLRDLTPQQAADLLAYLAALQ